jgi:hypothetical protein
LRLAKEEAGKEEDRQVPAAVKKSKSAKKR